MLFEYFFIGLVVGFLFYELTDISPGGVIAPAYCALYVYEPGRIAITLLLAAAVWAIMLFLSRHAILYGRRRLLLAVLLGFCIKVGIEMQFQPFAGFPLNMQSIGYIIPGLIANESSRQGFVKTAAALGVVSAITFLIIVLIR